MNTVFFKTSAFFRAAMSKADQSVLEIETGYTGEGQLFISNTSGQTVLECKITNNGTNQQIDLSNITMSGMYIVTLINESGITSKKIYVH
ncbi:MAG: T9SS type A sorting domain-containing protein [Chitinophagales bacterium]|nr:T9SS type A sorting domain-containing protein [Chitinophagales bacterium]